MKILRCNDTLSLVLFGCLAIGLAHGGPVYAGPDCDKRPDHPSCPGGGGEDPPSAYDPAFAYKVCSGRGCALYVANSDGSNPVKVFQFGKGNPYALHLRFQRSGESAGVGTGRIIYTWWGDGIELIEFDVANLGVRNAPAPVQATLISGPVDYMDLDMSPDGEKLAFEARNDSDEKDLYLATIDACIPGGCLVEDADKITGPTNDVHGLSWLPDGSGLIYSTGPEIMGVDFSPSTTICGGSGASPCQLLSVAGLPDGSGCSDTSMYLRSVGTDVSGNVYLSLMGDDCPDTKFFQLAPPYLGATYIRSCRIEKANWHEPSAADTSGLVGLEFNNGNMSIANVDLWNGCTTTTVSTNGDMPDWRN